MICKVTKGIKVSIKAYYKGFSDIDKNIFSYKVIIENKSDNKIKLLQRHWIIKDLGYFDSQVKEIGVVGKQPIISPNEIFAYKSAAKIKGIIGSMKGKYTFTKIDDTELFDVDIPEFKLIIPHILN